MNKQTTAAKAVEVINIAEKKEKNGVARDVKSVESAEEKEEKAMIVGVTFIGQRVYLVVKFFYWITDFTGKNL